MRTAFFRRIAPSFALAAVLGVGAGVSSVASTGCGSSTDTPATPATTVKTARSELARNLAPAVDDATLATFVADDNAFGLDLYGRLAKKDPSKNTFFSAASVSQAFAMLYGGSRGATEQEIAKGLRFTLPQDKLHAAANRLALELDSRANVAGSKGSDGKGFRLTMNNAFWGQETIEWEKPYLDLLAVNYGAGINLVDFVKAPEDARGTINAWTEEKTEKRIKELLPAGSLDTSTVFVLVNTVYFNAAWVEELQPSTLTWTTGAEVPAFGSVDGFGYAENDDGYAVSIPYEGRKLEFVVLVPKDLTAFEASLSPAKVDAFLGALSPKQLDLKVPKLKIEGKTISLKEELIALGLTTIFDHGDFTGMAKGAGFLVDDVYHQAFVKVNEKGTEAAAATAIVGRETSAAIDPPKVVRVDRPYVFFVRDVPTKAILFTGRVVSPEYSE
ncbi:MAG: serpin family protein [Polyangiaceae bacterium]